MDLLTYSAAKAEAEKQRLLAETYKAEVDDLKQQLQNLQEQIKRAAEAGMTMDKYLKMKEIDRQERAALQEETEYGKRIRFKQDIRS